MDRSDWEERWRERRIGFHRVDVNPKLVKYERRFLDDGSRRILVPLCGKSVDLPWLAARGHAVTGVEFVEQAVVDLGRENGIPFVVRESPLGRIHVSDGVTIHVGDFLEFKSDDAFDRIYDRAAFIAITPAHRERYAERIHELLAPGGRVLLETCEYDPQAMAGPPHCTPVAAVEECFGNHFRIELLEDEPVEVPERFRDRLTWLRKAVLLLCDRRAAAGSGGPRD